MYDNFHLLKKFPSLIISTLLRTTRSHTPLGRLSARQMSPDRRLDSQCVLASLMAGVCARWLRVRVAGAGGDSGCEKRISHSPTHILYSTLKNNSIYHIFRGP